jgi:hypothetical protein
MNRVEQLNGVDRVRRACGGSDDAPRLGSRIEADRWCCTGVCDLVAVETAQSNVTTRSLKAYSQHAGSNL